MNAFAVVASACAVLGLKPRERTLLRNCVWARTQTPNGYFLIPPSIVPAARRMIATGYLAQTKEQPEPFDPKGFGLVVVIEQEHFDKLITDAQAKEHLA